MPRGLANSEVEQEVSARPDTVHEKRPLKLSATHAVLPTMTRLYVNLRPDTGPPASAQELSCLVPDTTHA